MGFACMSIKNVNLVLSLPIFKYVFPRNQHIFEEGLKYTGLIINNGI